jgi:1,4-alpha-glucan branching enzyme
MITDLNALIRREPALHERDFHGDGFEWIDCHSRDDSVLGYMRKARNWEDHLLVVCNFTPVVRHNHRVGAPQPRYYEEVFNSDSQFYGGSNVGNFPGAMAQAPGHHGRPWCLTINLPPLAVVVFKPK